MSELILPPGKAKGCLPRKSRIGEICPIFGERIEVIPRGDWPDLLTEIDMRPHVKNIKDQDGVGSCATESTSLAEEIAEVFAGQNWTELNPWFIYHTTSGGRDSGSSIDENLAFARQYGIAPMSVWPRSKGWRAKPSDEAYEAARDHRIEEFYDIASWDEFGSALLTGFAVVFGYSGHSVCATSLISPEELEFANSWDESWGDRSFGRLKARSVHWGYGAFAVRVGHFAHTLPAAA